MPRPLKVKSSLFRGDRFWATLDRMKIQNPWKVSTFVLTGALACVTVYASVRPAQAEPQPRMQAALQLLQGAQKHLEAATHDKGGHRVKAIAATKEAIEQTQKGIAFDDKH